MLLVQLTPLKAKHLDQKKSYVSNTKAITKTILTNKILKYFETYPPKRYITSSLYSYISFTSKIFG